MFHDLEAMRCPSSDGQSAKPDRTRATAELCHYALAGLNESSIYALGYGGEIWHRA